MHPNVSPEACIYVRQPTKLLNPWLHKNNLCNNNIKFAGISCAIIRTKKLGSLIVYRSICSFYDVPAKSIVTGETIGTYAQLSKPQHFYCSP